MNPIEYIRRDIEGGDSDTRRRAAADLVKALAGAYDAELTTLCTGYVAALLQVSMEGACSKSCSSTSSRGTQLQYRPRQALGQPCPLTVRTSAAVAIHPLLPAATTVLPPCRSTSPTPSRAGAPRTARCTWSWPSPCGGRLASWAQPPPTAWSTSATSSRSRCVGLFSVALG